MSRTADTPSAASRLANADVGTSSARRRRSQGRKLRPPLKKAFTREEADPVRAI